MKKTIVVLLIIFSVSNSFAQQWDGPNNTTSSIYRRGSVGIGLSNPTERLDVNGTVKATQANFDLSLPNGSVFTTISQRNEASNVLRAGTRLSNSGSIFNLLDIPQSNLNSQAISLIGLEDRNYRSRWRFEANTGGESRLRYFTKTQSVFYDLREDGADNVFLQLPKANTFVTIGTDSYQDGNTSYMLSVNGDMRAQSVRVYTDWADYVFEANYDLPTLNEVEKYISKNGHLKDIPSANEVEQEGINVGEMNKLLLQKIEELTLYIIQQKKRIDQIEANN